MKTSREGLDFIIAREALKTKAYLDSGGVWTIGVGHTSAAGPPVPRSGMVITEQEAKDIFARDLVQYENAVSKALKRSPNQNQFDAMVSLCFNIGGGAFAISSVVRNFNAGNLKAASEAFLMWVKDNGKVIPGLVKRRELEKALFLKSSWVPVQPVPHIPAPMSPKPLPIPSAPQPVPPVVAVKLPWWKRLFWWA
jgi:lysozyme